MARTAELVTIKSLNEAVDSAKVHFQKAGNAERIAESVKENVEAHAMLTESATMHNEAALKDTRRVQVKVINALTDKTFTLLECEKLIALATELKLFESGDVVVTQPQPEDKKEEVVKPEVAPEVVNAPVIVGAVKGKEVVEKK